MIMSMNGLVTPHGDSVIRRFKVYITNQMLVIIITSLRLSHVRFKSVKSQDSGEEGALI